MGLEKQDLDTQSGVNSAPFVAIWMVAYNHENYINEAVESVMMQETDFEYKLFIGEDCSSDRTREICVRLKEKFPDKIELFLNKTNLGSKCNAEQIYKACFESRARYIALCEGDDYWTDPLKLQKQVDYLENNNEIVFCFHGAERLIENTGEIIPYVGLEVFKDREIVPKQILFLRAGGTYPTASAVFRKNVIEKLPTYFYSFGVGDTPLLLHALSIGEIGYLSDSMCVYRTTETNWSSDDSVFDNKLINYHTNILAYKEFDEATNYRFKEYLKDTISHLTYQIVYAYFYEEKNILKRFKFYLKFHSKFKIRENIKSLYRLIRS